MLNDLRFAFRLLLRQPTVAAVAIVTLGLGIGANAAIFSVVDAVLLRPLPYPSEDRIVVVNATARDKGSSAHSAPDFLDFQQRARSFDALAAYRRMASTLTDPSADPARVASAATSARFFDVFQVRAARGRTFSDSDRRRGERLVVLSHPFWTSHYGQAADVVGRSVHLDGESYNVAGIMPAGFDWPQGTDAWVLARRRVPESPVSVPGDVEANREVRYLDMIGRLRSGTSFDAARTEASAIASEFERQHPRSNEGRRLDLTRLRDEVVGDVRPVLIVLLASVGLVLLIACANVASLLLARAAGRRREVAVRSALGASRLRLVRQLLTESLLLAVAGGAAGLLIGLWVLSLLLSVVPAGLLPVQRIALDWRVVTATMMASAATGLIFGLMPALHATRLDLVNGLKERDGAAATPGRGRPRQALVAAQVALTFVLLIWAALLVNSMLRLQRVDTGYRTDSVMMAGLSIPQQRYDSVAKQSTLYRRLVEAVSTDPRVESAAVAFPDPLQAANASGTFTIESAPESRSHRPYAAVAFVSPAFFKTLGIPLVTGRTFTERDTEQGEQVAVVSRALARKYWRNADPIGQRVRFGDASDDFIRIVGIVGDVHNAGLREEPAPTMYIPYTQFSLPFTTLIVRTTADAGGVRKLVRNRLAAIDPAIPIDRVISFDEYIERGIAQPRFRAFLVVAFAGLALVLATIGLYGSLSYSVAQRVRDIGVRLALGAERRQVLMPVVREGLGLAAVGIAAGAVVALLSRRVVSAFLFGIGSTDVATYAGVAVILLAVTFVATFLPARRATEVDPMVVMRAE